MQNSIYCNYLDSTVILVGDIRFAGDALVDGHVVGSVGCVGQGARLILGESSSVGQITMPEESVVRKLSMVSQDERSEIVVRGALEDERLLGSAVLSLAWGPFVGQIKAGKDVVFCDEDDPKQDKSSFMQHVINLLKRKNP